MSKRTELALLVAILLAAALFRFHRPSDAPPGPSHDELRMIDLGELIVEGERPIHWTISYSAEPFFMYLLALEMPVWGFTPFGARLVTRSAGVLLIPVVYRLARRLFGRRTALITAGVLGVTWWPVFFGRVALRGITLPLIFTAALYCIWRGLDLSSPAETRSDRAIRWRWLIPGGALMGFTWYTFTAARGLVMLLPMLLAHLALMRLVEFGRWWRVALVTLGVAGLVIAPFVYEMQVHPGAPESRLDQLGGVIDELLAGNPLPFLKQTVNTLGMFILTGDPDWRYNVPGRPVFGPVLGLFSILGLLVGAWRWRQPRYFAVVTWVFLGLAPSMLTPEAPSFVRAIGALPAAAMLPGIGCAAAWDWIAETASKNVVRIASALLAVLLALNGLATFHDFFVTWPIQPQVREIYQAALTEAFRDLSHSDLDGPIWISEPFPDDRHLLLAKRLLQREQIEPRWFDASRALILPPVDGARRYLLANFVQPDRELFARWMDGETIVLEGEVPASANEPTYRLCEVKGGSWIEGSLSRITERSTAFVDPAAKQDVSLPISFQGMASILGYELSDDQLAPGDDLHLTVYWRVRGPVYEPLASFAHLLEGPSDIVGQYDGFDVPPWHWEPGAVVAQVYRFPISQDAQPGPHWLEVGLYNSQTMERLHVVDDAGRTLADRLLLESVELRK